MAALVAIALFCFSCNSTKKLLNRESKSTDSSVTESRNTTSKVAEDRQLSITAVDSSSVQKESSYEAVKVDSGYDVIQPGHDKVHTTKRTIFFLPKVSLLEKKVSTKKIDQVVKKVDTASAIEAKEVAVKSETKLVTKDISKKRSSPLIWIGIAAILAFAFLVWVKKIF